MKSHTKGVVNMTVLTLERTITSLEIAEMVEREHPKVMRDIRNIIEHLGGQTKIGQSYFIASTYTNSQNKQQPCFDLTKKGCELYGTRMTGTKGTQFAVAYIERFNEMEQTLQQPQPLTEKEQLLASMKLTIAMNEEVEGLKQEFTAMKGQVVKIVNTMRIDTNEEMRIQSLAKQKAVDALGGMDSPAYRNRSIRSKAFSAVWREFKQFFVMPRYGDLPKARLDEALEFLNGWRPSRALEMEIQAINQTALPVLHEGATV